MWASLGWIAWALSAILILWMVWDFFTVTRSFGEDVLLSSREGVDELYSETSKAKGN